MLLLNSQPLSTLGLARRSPSMHAHYLHSVAVVATVMTVRSPIESRIPHD